MNVIGLVLAGGLSRRMGSDKAMLQWPTGSNQLERSYQLLEDICCSTILVSRQETSSDAYTYIQDCYPDQGPLAGIHAALRYLREQQISYDALLVIPVDMPLLDTTVLQPLLDQSLQHQCSSFYQKHFLPCVLSQDDVLEQQIEQQLQNQNNALKHILHSIGAKILVPDSLDKLTNTNTPEEWREAQQQCENSNNES